VFTAGESQLLSGLEALDLSGDLIGMGGSPAHSDHVVLEGVRHRDLASTVIELARGELVVRSCIPRDRPASKSPSTG
jgi:hypothetical protein